MSQCIIVEKVFAAFVPVACGCKWIIKSLRGTTMYILVYFSIILVYFKHSRGRKSWSVQGTEEYSWG